MSLIMVDLFAIFSDGYSKLGVIRVKAQFREWISKDGLIMNFFYIDAGSNFFVVKFYQALINCIQKFSLFVFF